MIAERIDHARHDGAGLQARNIADARPTHREKDIGASKGFRPGDDLGPGGTISIVGETRTAGPPPARCAPQRPDLRTS